MTVRTEALARRFRSRQAVRGVTFEAGPGHPVGLLGPNGAGKTTLLRMLVTTLVPTGGRAEVAGWDVARQPLEVRRRVGYLPEAVPLPEGARVAELVGFLAAARGLTVAEGRRRAAVLLERLGLEGFEGRIVSRLSRGQRQRVGLMLALLGQPEVLVLDEPTTGLDPAQVVALRNLLAEVAATATVLFSSHVLSEVAALCREVVVLVDGQTLAVCPLAEVPARAGLAPRLRVRASGCSPGHLGAVVTSAGGQPVNWQADGDGWCAELPGQDGLAGALTRRLVEAGAEVREVAVVQPTLEDAFLALTERTAQP